MRIGILGGGQLARMMALAGYPLGLDFTVLCPAEDACAAPLADHICARFDDQSALHELAGKTDLITYEFENVPAESVDLLNANNAVYPPTRALMLGRDRLLEKNLFNELGIRTAPFAAVDSLADLEQAVKTVGRPAILKSRTEGYDGKGQQLIREDTVLADAWQANGGAAAILEGFVPFSREVSIIAVRSRSGEMAFYPLSENIHLDGILRLSRGLDHDPMQSQAEGHARRLLAHLDYVGVLAIEFFEHQGELLVNEYAPRVHNSGHWTIEGAETSQFENHLRAIIGLPLGPTNLYGRALMINLIGEIPAAQDVLVLPGAHLHLYGKRPRPGRKVGHITLHGENEERFALQLDHVRKLPGVSGI